MIFSCKENSKISSEITAIPIGLDVIRFDREFATTDNLPGLRAKYPFFFPESVPDSIWQRKLTDTLQQELAEAVDSTFGRFETEISELTLFYRHLIYYFPDTSPPSKIITLTSDVDYTNRMILTDTLLLIGLDNYLGPEHRFYRGIDRYIANGLDRRYLLRDVALAHSAELVPPPNDRTFLAQMIYHGKRLYLAEQLLPTNTEAQILGYSDEQYEWARTNEDPIWRYFIERELLYNTDRDLVRRFIDDAPFSKFRLELDRESPGRIGQYIGWRIVKAYASNHDVPLAEILALDAKTLFNASKFKPKK